MDLLEHNQKAQEKLAEAKSRVQLFAMDYDGTLADGEKHQREDAIKLMEEILAHGKIPAVITARAATAVKTFMPPFEEYYKQHPDSPPTYIAGGNGTVLYHLDAKGISQIYSHGLTLEEIKNIAGRWQAYAHKNLPADELSEKGLKTFKEFYSQSWDGLIPLEILDIGRPFDGRIFTEQAKVTFVFPKDSSKHPQIVKDMQALVGDSFSVAAGDEHFCHITKRLSEDSKKVAIKTILDLLNLNEDQVVTFGDMPHGNDAGLLSFPYSFTNSEEFATIKADLELPPYFVNDEKQSRVAGIYKAIEFLLL